jgi:hypothetical protein
VHRRHRVVQRLRFFVERELRALQHAHAGPQRLELTPEIFASQDDERIAAVGSRELGDLPD